MALWNGARLAGRGNVSRSKRLSQRWFGLLKVGEPLSWEESVPHIQYVREHGVKQFLNQYRRVLHFANDRLFYGDEVEHAILKVDPDTKTVKLSLRSAELLEILRKRESEGQAALCTWHQEYGSWMVESTPSMPYGGYTSSLLQMESNMRLRRARLLAVLAPDEIAPTMVNFPLMGVGDHTHPAAPAGGPSSESDAVPDAVINGHPRFGTLTANIRSRRGSKVDIRMPQFQDVNTELVDGVVPDIEMDCMADGMGCCCLQVTFQASDIDESKYLCDQLAPLAPIMLALTAATPIFRGRLANVDARWATVSASVDCRRPAERGEDDNAEPDLQLAGGGVRRIAKSRYDSISSYLSTADPVFNDIPCEIDEEVKAMLLRENVDSRLAHHVAHLFVRDPLVMFRGSIEEVDDNMTTEHFDSLNSTNWQTVRWKPPPVQSEGQPHIGWRAEFRSMEVQFTDFENAAFSAFIVLITRVLLVFDLDFLVPLSKLDINMQRAHTPNAVSEEKFWFRSHVLPSRKALDSSEEMTMCEIICGKGSQFPGLVPLCYVYLEHIQCDPTSFARIDQYLRFISKRANGSLQTPATWMRDFVKSHPEYKQDSVVTDSIAYDLMQAADEIGRGARPCPELLGDVKVDPVTGKMTGYATALKSMTSREARSALMLELTARADDADGPGSLPCAPRRHGKRTSASGC